MRRLVSLFAAMRDLPGVRRQCHAPSCSCLALLAAQFDLAPMAVPVGEFQHHNTRIEFVGPSSTAGHPTHSSTWHPWLCLWKNFSITTHVWKQLNLSVPAPVLGIAWTAGLASPGGAHPTRISSGLAAAGGQHPADSSCSCKPPSSHMHGGHHAVAGSSRHKATHGSI